jgi:hypothetical protein
VRFIYWAALAVGVVLVFHAVLIGALIGIHRLNAVWAMECMPNGLVGMACFGPVESSGYLLEATLAIRAAVGVGLIWAFVSYRRETLRS